MNMETCGICKNSVSISAQVLTPCKHSFCGECFFKWMERRTNCPICRKGFGNTETNINIIEVENRLERLILSSEEWEEYLTYLRENIDESEVLLTSNKAKCIKLLDKIHTLDNEIRVKTEDLRNRIDIINSRNRIHARRFNLQLY
jgi:hypothetical protein